MDLYGICSKRCGFYPEILALSQPGVDERALMFQQLNVFLIVFAFVLIDSWVMTLYML